MAALVCACACAHSGSSFMHVITNRPVGPLRHSAFLSGLRLHFQPPPPPLPSHRFSAPPLFTPCFFSMRPSFLLATPLLSLLAHSWISLLPNLGGEDCRHRGSNNQPQTAVPLFCPPPSIHSCQLKARLHFAVEALCTSMCCLPSWPSNISLCQ